MARGDKLVVLSYVNEPKSRSGTKQLFQWVRQRVLRLLPPRIQLMIDLILIIEMRPLRHTIFMKACILAAVNLCSHQIFRAAGDAAAARLAKTNSFNIAPRKIIVAGWEPSRLQDMIQSFADTTPENRWLIIHGTDHSRVVISIIRN